jgi:cardiolipin synthase
MQGLALHAKTFTVDGIYSSIGSFNFDLWSGTGNLETNIGVWDPETTSVLDKQFEEDVVRCVQVHAPVRI